MLEPPISELDIERKTVFRTRKGGTAMVIKKQYGMWQVRYESGITSCVGGNGRFYADDELSENDLIARIEEPAMKSQVIVEDNRHQKQPEWVPFDELPPHCLFITKGDPDDVVRFNGCCRSAHLCIIAGDRMAVVAHCKTRDDRWEHCRVLANLRLRLVLENAT